MSAARIVVDYSSGIDPKAFPSVAVITPDVEHQRRGDPPARAAYTAAFVSTVASGPLPVVCLVGPYGYSPAQTAASGARNDLARQKLNPDGVRVFNTGRSFLALGALTAALATSGLDPDAAFRWLDRRSPDSSMWLVARTAALKETPSEAHLETPGGLPAAEFSLIRLRLSGRVVGGFPTAQAALDDAIKRAAAPDDSVALTVSPPNFGCSPASSINANFAFDVPAPLVLREWFGECAAFGIAPMPSEEESHA